MFATMEWIERIADCFVWFIPLLAIFGLVLSRFCHDECARVWSQRVFFASFLLVAGGTFRTVLVSDPSWLLHTLSLGIMVIGALIPTTPRQPFDSEELWTAPRLN